MAAFCLAGLKEILVWGASQAVISFLFFSSQASGSPVLHVNEWIRWRKKKKRRWLLKHHTLLHFYWHAKWTHCMSARRWIVASNTAEGLTRAMEGNQTDIRPETDGTRWEHWRRLLLAFLNMLAWLPDRVQSRWCVLQVAKHCTSICSPALPSACHSASIQPKQNLVRLGCYKQTPPMFARKKLLRTWAVPLRDERKSTLLCTQDGSVVPTSPLIRGKKKGIDTTALVDFNQWPEVRCTYTLQSGKS